MSTLEDTDRKQFLNILIRHPFLENDRKRRALLINCGLEHLLSEIETAGSPRDFVHLLYAQLTKNLTTKQSRTPWLVSLLTYLIDLSGPQDLSQGDREFLVHLIQEWWQKFTEREAGPENDTVNADNRFVSETPNLPGMQIKTAENREREDTEAEQSYLKYVVKNLEWLEITGLPNGVIAQSAPLDEVFIPLQLRPNRPLTEYPLTERELTEYYRRLKYNLPLRDLERFVFEAEKNWSTREHKPISMNDFWQSLTSERPAAIIQGYPGVGKSTLLKYLALYMTRRSLKQRSRAILAPFTPTLIPFLVSLGDFANERSKNTDLSLTGYLQLKLSRLHVPGLTLFLEKSLEAGKCLILLDGLDEVNNQRMRIEVQTEIKEFILTYSDLFEESTLFNRFLVTTRVAGYDQAAFPVYPHYTIAELTLGQIDDFLPRWCRAIVRLDPAFARIAQNEPARFEREVQQRTEELQISIHKRPELQTLVENPLLLTLLALMQQNQVEVPRRRVDLYRIFTQTLLERRSEVRGTPLIPETQAILRLGPLALHMQETTNSFLHQNDVIASLINTIRLEGGIADPQKEAEVFLYKLRVHVGIFVLRAGDYYGFIHRTFQEYFAACYLIHSFILNPGGIRGFADKLCKQYDIWREPFLLAVAYASGKDEMTANTMVSALLNMLPNIDDEDQALHLQIAVESVIEAEQASIDPALEKSIAEQLLQLYERAQQSQEFERCERMEELIRRWLSSLPEHLQRSMLLIALYEAVSYTQRVTYQRAVLILLSRIIEQQRPWPDQVLAAVIPPLLALAGLPAIGEYQPTPGLAASSNLAVADLALINLSMLGIQGPAGLLPEIIRQYFSDHPEQLRILARHSVDSGVLLTPTIIPRKDESNRKWPGDVALQQWLLQRGGYHIGHERQRYEDLCLSIHQDLLEQAEEMRYPLTLHILQALERARQHPEQSWQKIWQDHLTSQINSGRYIGYQESALFWSTIFPESEELKKLASLIVTHLQHDGLLVQRYAERFLATLGDNLRIQEELREADEALDRQFLQYLRYWLDIGEIHYIQDIQNLRCWRYLRDMHNLQNLRDVQGEESLRNPQYIQDLQAYLFTAEVTERCLTRLALVPFNQEEYADLLTILLGRVLYILETKAKGDSIEEEVQQIARAIRLDIPPVEKDERSAIVLDILRYLRFIPAYLPVHTAKEVCTVLELAEKIPDQWVQQICDAALQRATPEVLKAGEVLMKVSRQVKKEKMNSGNPACDVCVICALSEEAESFIRETSRLCHVAFQRTFGPQTKREYRYTIIRNNEGELLTLYVTWLPLHGPEEMALHFKPVLAELQPRFAAMTGICAGDKERVVLGDLIVAERAFLYDTGKFVSGKRGRKKQLYDTNTHQPHSDILQFVQMFDSWKAAIAELSRPISKRQQRDWLLNTLLQEPTMGIDDIPQQQLEQYAPDWKMIVSELQVGSQPYLTRDGVLRDLARVRELSSQKGFPFTDPAFPKRHIAAMASGSAVRSDNPFKEIQVPVRGAVAIDMEGATFYRTVAEFAGLRSLLVKGVCDYADPEKDDSYHDYASSVSAVYVVSFIKDYVTIALMTRPGHQLSTSELGTIDQQPLRNDQESGQSRDMASSRTILGDSSSTSSIKLDKAQREQIHKALLSAFPSRLDLKQMVDFGLDQNLDGIVANSNLDHAVFELIKWAEAHGKVSELIRAAYQANSGNVQLRAFVSQMGFLGAPDS